LYTNNSNTGLLEKRLRYRIKEVRSLDIGIENEKAKNFLERQDFTYKFGWKAINIVV